MLQLRPQLSRSIAPAVILALAGAAMGQTSWTGPSGNNPSGDWFLPANWNNGVPGMNTDATIDPGNATITAGNALAKNLFIGRNNNLGGQLSVKTGTMANPGLRVSNQLFIGDNPAGFGSLVVGAGPTPGVVRVGSALISRTASGNVEVVGTGSQFIVDGDATFALDGLDGAGGAFGQINLVSNARASVGGNLKLAVAPGSRALATITAGYFFADSVNLGRDGAAPNRFASNGGINIGVGGNPAVGDTDDATFAFHTTMNIGDADFTGGVGFVNLNPSTGRQSWLIGTNANGSINQDAIAIVNGSNGKLIGSGQYQCRVRYRSDPVFGTLADQSVDLEFGYNQLRRSTIYSVTSELTRPNTRSDGTAGIPGFASFDRGGGIIVGTQRAVPAQLADTFPQQVEKRNTLQNAMLPGTSINIKWGGANAPADIAFLNAPTPESRPTLSVPFDGGAVAANITPRLRMWQIGATLATPSTASPAGFKAGEIRNITDSVDSPNGVVIGRTQNVGGSDFDVAIGGLVATPVHQDSRITALQQGSGLTGAGVVMGQVEPGLPMQEQGAFDNWSSNDPSARRLSYSVGFTASGGAPAPINAGAGVPAAAASNPHSTRVAAIMMGYDPLGIQVDGQSRFESADARIGTGFGYTGVAPGATLVSRNSAGTSDYAALAKTPGMKIINESAGVPGAGGGRPPADNGTDTDEIAIDYWIKKQEIIYTKSAGNDGRYGAGTITIPGGNYNGITVGNAENTANVFSPTNFNNPDLWRVSDSSSRGPLAAPSARAKPDLVAQGTANNSPFVMESSRDAGAYDPAYPALTNRGLYGTWSRGSSTPYTVNIAGNNYQIPAADAVEGSSFAAPTVAGAAALMVQRARQVPALNSGQSPLVVKSIMQTSADKNATWTRGSGVADNANDGIPLSYSWGAGLLDPRGAINLLNSGEKTHGAAAINGDGWNLDTITADTNDAYNFPGSFGTTGQVYKLANVAAGSPFVATLNWYRDVTSNYFDEIGPLGPGQTRDLTNIIYTANAGIADLDLFLYRVIPMGNPILVASSNSTIDNLEHIFIPSITMASDYLLRVRYGAGGLAAEPYGISWSFAQVPAPESAGMLVILGVYAFRRRRSTAV